MKFTSIQSKILLALLPFVLGLILFVFYVRDFSQTILTNSQNLQGVFEKNLAVQEFRSINYGLSSATRLYALTGEAQYDVEHYELSKKFEETYNELISKKTNAPQDLLIEYRKVTNKLKGTELLILSKAREGNVVAAMSLFDAYYLEQQDYANSLLDRYLQFEKQEAERSINANIHAIASIEKTFILLAVLFLFTTAGLIFIFLRKFVVKPIESLSSVAQQIQGGNLDIAADVNSDDELGTLAESFNSMTEKLKDEIMKRAKENQQLRDLDAQKSQFISVAAHQLRTPLSGLKWALNMIASGSAGTLPPDVKELIDKSYESNERMISLVNDMLGAARLESGELSFNYKEENVHDLMNVAISEIQSVAQRKSIAIKLIDASENIPVVYIDADKVRQVFQNLLENSIKYTPVGGNVEVIIKQDKDMVVVGVKDNGIGIPKSEEVHVFTRFFRGANAIKFETDGTGLGLFIAKELIEKQKGKIWFENNVGQGTTFYVALPIVKKK